MASSMRAVVLSAPGPVDNLQIRQLPLPEPESGWVRIKVEAFGLNRSELHTRLGLAEGVIFPRVLGIECVGVVDANPDGDLQVEPADGLNRRLAGVGLDQAGAADGGGAHSEHDRHGGRPGDMSGVPLPILALLALQRSESSQPSRSFLA